MSNAPVEPTDARIGRYSPPKLTIYGSVKTLTAAGTRGVSENGNRPNCSGQTDRRTC